MMDINNKYEDRYFVFTRKSTAVRNDGKNSDSNRFWCFLKHDTI